MASEGVLPLLAGVLSGAFAVMVTRQYANAKRPYQIAWAGGLAAYSLASLIEAYVTLWGWSVPLFRLYFPLAGATVGLLGVGTIYLLGAKRGAHAFALIILALLVLAAAGQFLVPLTPSDLAGKGADLGAKPIPLPNAGRIAFLIVNIVGGLALIVGALWSWARTHRAGVLLIGVGAVFPFVGGSMTTLLHLDLRVTFQFLGIAIMFAGYLQGREAEGLANAAAHSTKM
ncbi:MAG: hypothetical protein WDA16_04430 [Candidatus Thermoplasmatota archaeon]